MSINDVLSGAARWHVEQGDCLDVLRALPDASVDAVVTDPPYFRVKAEWWDRQWETPSGFLAWLDLLIEQWARVLKPNGSLYCFASPQMGAHVEIRIAQRLRVLNRIVWRKSEGRHKAAEKEALRSFFPASEVIVFAEVRGSDAIAKGEAGYVSKCDELRGFVFEPLRAYLDGERERAGASRAKIDEAWRTARGGGGGMSGHWFSRVQWSLPTRANYEWLRVVMGGGSLRREYEDLRRPFAVTADMPYTDVWDFPTVSHRAGKHPCEKPDALIRHIVRASTRPNAMILDSFTGSGVVGAVAVEEGRRFVGSEIDGRWAQVASARIGSCRILPPVEQSRALPVAAPDRAAPTGQLLLFRKAA